MRCDEDTKFAVQTTALVLVLVVVAVWVALLPPTPPPELAFVEPVVNTPQLPRVEVSKAEPIAKEGPPMAYKYYHCIDDVLTPGTPPEDDPGHWEEVEAPDGIEDGESVFGNGAVGNTSIESLDEAWLVGSRYPVAGGASTEDGYYAAPHSWPTLPSTITWDRGTSGQVSTYAVYDAGTGRITAAYMYLKIIPDGANYNNVLIAVYDNAGNLHGKSDIVTVNNQTGAWVRFPFSDNVVVSEGDDYHLLGWVEYGLAASAVMIGVGSYELPDGGEWDPDRDYEYCQTVIRDIAAPTPPTSSSAGGPLFTGGGML